MEKKIERLKQLSLGLKDFILAHKLEMIVLGIILFIGAFLRLYRIAEYMTFLGDEGRDVIVVRRLLVNADPILVGPGTSIGNMYLGPIYYYLMAPSLFLANYNPVGPAIQIALLSVLTIAFVWWIGREWFAPLAGLVAAGLYAIAPTIIIYSRSSWNPNIMPFFALLCIYGIWRVWQKREFIWLLISGISLAFCLQSHYLGLLLIPVLGLFWLWTLIQLRIETKQDQEKKIFWQKFLRQTFLTGLIFVLLMSPLVVFDARHGWNNFQAMKTFFTERQTTVSARPWTALPKIPDLLLLITTRLLTARNEMAGKIILALITIPSLILIFFRKDQHKYESQGFLILLVWLLTALIGLGVYKQHVYDHYFGFFFAAPFLILGGFSQAIIENLNKLGKTIFSASLLLLVVINFYETPIKVPPTRQLQRSIKVAERIEELASGEKFNFAVIAERNYEGAYQYFLEKNNAPFIIIDPQRLEQTVTNQLFVVCEMEEEKCDPTHNPKAEITGFGWTKIEDQWNEEGIIIYKLVHSK